MQSRLKLNGDESIPLKFQLYHRRVKRYFVYSQTRVVVYLGMCRIFLALLLEFHLYLYQAKMHFCKIKITIVICRVPNRCLFNGFHALFYLQMRLLFACLV